MLSKVRSAARSFYFPSWSVPFALLILVFLSYGLRALSLGFYWDDWPYLWFFQRLGPAGIVDAFTRDRPFLSFIYNTTLSIFGTSHLAWQTFALLTRWLCSLGLWWALSLAWPQQTQKSAWAVMLFTVYPGFTQQWISVIYGQAFFLYALVFFSTGLTLWGVNRRHSLSWWKILIGTILALGLSGFTMFSTEYFFGLELLRPILLWIVLSPTNIDYTGHAHHWLERLKRTFAWWLPYLLLMIVFIIWRGFIHVFTSAKLTTLQGISQSPLHQLASLALTIVEDLVEATLAAWGQTLQLNGFIEGGASAGLRLLGIILASGVIFTLYLTWLRPKEANNDESEQRGESWAWQALLVGICITLAAGWPFWITGLPMRMGFPQDRYSLPLAPGISLFLAGLLDLLGGQIKGNFGFARKAAVMGIALGLAAGFHSNFSLQYRQDWNQMRNFFWQLSWRAPAVQPGTLFLTKDLPFNYFEDDSLNAPLNWTYDPDGRTKTMAYLLYDLRVRQYALPSLQPDRPVEKDFNAVKFTGTTSQTLALYYSPPGCVRVLDPVYDAEIYQLPDTLQVALLLSNPRKWIQNRSAGAAPPVEIFGSEPKHRWCYFYEKAELARQEEDWETILKIYRESIKKGIRPEDPVEYLPFIEGYARLGMLDDAIQLVLSTYAASPDLRPALCGVWNRAIQSGAQPNGIQLNRMKNILSCSLP